MREQDNNVLAKRYNLSTLIAFAAPTMIMMLFNALYTGVDAIFVSRFVGSISVVLFVICALIAPAITGLYTKQGSATNQIAVSGFQIFMFCFLFNGLDVFTSAVFTALSNGKVSAILSFVRTFVLLTVFLLVFPHFFGVNGIWLATPSADFIGALLSIALLLGYRKKYFGETHVSKN